MCSISEELKCSSFGKQLIDHIQHRCHLINCSPALCSFLCTDTILFAQFVSIVQRLVSCLLLSSFPTQLSIDCNLHKTCFLCNHLRLQYIFSCIISTKSSLLFSALIFHSWCTCVSIKTDFHGYLSSASSKLAQGWNQNKYPYGLLQWGKGTCFSFLGGRLLKFCGNILVQCVSGSNFEFRR